MGKFSFTRFRYEHFIFVTYKNYQGIITHEGMERILTMVVNNILTTIFYKKYALP